MGFLDKLFGSYSEKELKRIQPTVDSRRFFSRGVISRSSSSESPRNRSSRARTLSGDVLDLIGLDPLPLLGDGCGAVLGALRLNTDLVCDAINVAMREIFKQLVYGRSQTAFSEGGLPIGAGLEGPPPQCRP